MRRLISFRLMLFLIAFSVLPLACDDGELAGSDGGGDADAGEDESELIIIIDVDGDEDDLDSQSEKTDAEDELEIAEFKEEVETIPIDAGTGYRFTEILVVEPVMVVDFGGGTPYDINQILNEQLRNALEGGRFNGILKPETEDFLVFPYNMRLFLADAVGDDYIPTDDIDYMVEVVETETPRRFTSTENLDITIPIPMDQMPDDITLRDALLRGTYTESLDGIENGYIAGAISEEQAETIEVYNGVTLKQVFTWLAIAPDYNFAEGGMGYSFIFSYISEAVSIVGMSGE